MKIFDATLTSLERALDVRLARQGVLAGNLANSDTPGFAPRDLDFARAMAAAAPGSLSSPALEGRIGPGQIPLTSAASGSPSSPDQFITQVPGAGAGLDGNAVDVDRTLAAVAENALQYGAVARAAGKKLAILRYVANDGQG